ncbi:integrase, catalytic region, zinc finger, CCHC-type containing protein [Tanacetum coccineum]|uniref:Integrase, catalytic region, zinc finger, CCHC-type containing protein n=1 Tax=Tanacetum coccineum TaxID=301880 RepID=A0ABQ4ZIU0_9ASTR
MSRVHRRPFIFCLIELENQVQRLMEAYLAPNPPIQVNKIASSCEICSGPHDTQYCMENPEQAFVDYASSRTDEAGGSGSLSNPSKTILVTPIIRHEKVTQTLVTKGISETTIEGYMENYKIVSQDIRNQLDAKAEAVQIILTWIDNDIYSIFDVCPNACEMWKAIKRLKQSESINVQDLETNLYWEFGKLTSRDGESLKSYYLRNRGKAIVNSHPPTYDQEPTMVAEDDKMSKEKEIDKLMALISLSFNKIYKPNNNILKTSSNTSRANQDNTPRINTGTGECQKPKRAKDAAYHKEKMLFYKQEEAGIQEHPEQPKSVNVTYLKEHGDTNITIDLLDMSNNGGESDQDEDDDLLRLKKFQAETDRPSNVNLFVLLVEMCVDDNHDMYVLHYINGVNARTKMPMAVPISTREPKRTVNQYVATPLEKTVALESTNQKPRITIRKQYEQISTTSRRDNSIHHRLLVLKAHDGKCQASKNVTIKRVYYIEGLNHNLFSVGQFCNADLEVAFWNSACYIRDLKGNNLLTATSSQAWLWHRSSLFFVSEGSKTSVFQTSNYSKLIRDLQNFNMDLCGPMRVESFIDKKYVLVIIDDYSRYTWTHFLSTKDETLEVLIDFLKLVQRGLHAQVRTVQTEKAQISNTT